MTKVSSEFGGSESALASGSSLRETPEVGAGSSSGAGSDETSAGAGSDVTSGSDSASDNATGLTERAAAAPATPRLRPSASDGAWGSGVAKLRLELLAAGALAFAERAAIDGGNLGRGPRLPCSSLFERSGKLETVASV